MIKKLDQIRSEKKIYKQDVADHIGITTVSLNNYVTGKRQPHYKVIEQYADLLGYEIKLQLK